jgi:hypothetical protein
MNRSLATWRANRASSVLTEDSSTKICLRLKYKYFYGTYLSFEVFFVLIKYKQKLFLSEISGTYVGDCLLGRCAVQSLTNWLTFQRCLLPPVPGLSVSFTRVHGAITQRQSSSKVPFSLIVRSANVSLRIYTCNVSESNTGLNLSFCWRK